MAQAEERDLAQVVGQRVDVETVQRLELRVRGAARPHQVGVVGVREPVGVGARRGEHGLLLEREHEVDGAGRHQDVGDRLGSLGVGGRVRAPLLDAELGAEAGRERGEEARSVGLGGADLEVRVARAAERSGAEQRAAEVGGRAAAPGDDAVRRTAERPVGAVEDARRDAASRRRLREPSTWSW